MLTRRVFLASAASGLLAACTTGVGQVALHTGPSMMLVPETDEPHDVAPVSLSQIPQQFHRQYVRNPTGEPPGTIVVDPDRRYLYLVLDDGRALRYGIGVGREGFGWNGTATIKRKAKWPRWTPPAEMVARDQMAAKWAGGMPGGSTNPLGARALYLFQGNRDTLYRIHGTAEPKSIGRAVSSGCIRLLNADVIDLYDRVPIGTRVVVRPSRGLIATLVPEQLAARPAPDPDSDWRASIRRIAGI